MEISTRIVNDVKLLTNYGKRSILDVWLRFEYVFTAFGFIWNIAKVYVARASEHVLGEKFCNNS